MRPEAAAVPLLACGVLEALEVSALPGFATTLEHSDQPIRAQLRLRFRLFRFRTAADLLPGLVVMNASEGSSRVRAIRVEAWFGRATRRILVAEAQRDGLGAC